MSDKQAIQAKNPHCGEKKRNKKYLDDAHIRIAIVSVMYTQLKRQRIADSRFEK